MHFSKYFNVFVYCIPAEVFNENPQLGESFKVVIVMIFNNTYRTTGHNISEKTKHKFGLSSKL
jgi:hypothetical protein